MSATKVTLLFHAATLNSAGQNERLAGFSESYYSSLAIDNPTLKTNWNALAIARANLLPANVSIVGSRYQTVDPAGGSRQYDNKYPPGSTVQNDLPGVSLSWTVRSQTTPNQRALILRGTPDGRVVNGEYAPSAAYNTALQAFFNELINKWQFRAIDRTVLPVKIVTITAGLMTTVAAHGLFVGDIVNVMSTKVGTDAVKTSYAAFVQDVPSANTALLAALGRMDTIPNSLGGRVRRQLIHYPFFSITSEEVINPTPIHRKAGAPFKKFRGRRTARR